MELSNSKIVIFEIMRYNLTILIPVIGYGSATSDEICSLFAYNLNTVQIFPLIDISIISRHKNQVINQKQRNFLAKYSDTLKKNVPDKVYWNSVICWIFLYYCWSSNIIFYTNIS